MIGILNRLTRPPAKGEDQLYPRQVAAEKQKQGDVRLQVMDGHAGRVHDGLLQRRRRSRRSAREPTWVAWSRTVRMERQSSGTKKGWLVTSSCLPGPLFLRCPAAFLDQGVTAEIRVPQLPRVTRVPPQLPNGAAVYCESVQLCAMYSLAIQTVFPSVAAAA